jgi:hypothetical protein
MKKQFQILAATFITVAFVSCSKQDLQTTQTPDITGEDISASSSSSRPYVDPLTIALDARYTFDKHLKDVTNQQADGVPSSRGAAIYTYDRKGIANAALKFDENYYVSIANMPVQQKMSLSVWVKKANPYYGGASPIIRHNSTGIALMQDEYGFWARVHSYTNSSMTTSLYSGDFNDQAWHHIVITYSAEKMTMYVDNQQVGPTSNVFSVGGGLTKYLLGYSHGIAGNYWEGAIDDLRFYGRTLSASDVQKLFNQ